MKHQFSQIPKADIPRSSFNRSHGYKTTFDAGYLVPFYVDEALPGDTFNLRHNIFARLATPVTPFMDNLFLDTFYFAVPVRLLWEHWTAFQGERYPDPDSSTDYLIPQIAAPVGGWQVGSLSDYFGLPTGIDNIEVSALWHRAYNLIWNEWFRDENLQDSVKVNLGDGPDPDSDYTLLKRCKRHDYFTSALPWPQKGPGVELPLGEKAPVTGIGKYNQTYVGGQESLYVSGGNIATFASFSPVGQQGSNYWFNVEEDPDHAGYPGIYADLSSATAATINSLRQAFQIQKLYERDARGGTRYTEIIRSHFGVTSPDARLQRPEYLGGSSQRVTVNPVQQTSATDPAVTPQGNLAGVGYVTDTGHGFTKSFTEHMILMGLVNVRADLTYQQGIPRMFSRQTRFDYYMPVLAHLGEQAILNQEIYAQGYVHEPMAEDPVDLQVFGYQERWAEYRYFPSQITGKLRSTYDTSLDVWHLSQEFESLPVLDDNFIQEDPPIARVIAVPTEPHFIFDSYIELKCARPMPVYSVPGLVDHF